LYTADWAIFGERSNRFISQSIPDSLFVLMLSAIANKQTRRIDCVCQSQKWIGDRQRSIK
jgi:hypothetical protein